MRNPKSCRRASSRPRPAASSRWTPTYRPRTSACNCEAKGGPALRWRIDGRPAGQGAALAWLPWPGRHRVELLDAQGQMQDSVQIEVRGAGVKPAPGRPGRGPASALPVSAAGRVDQLGTLRPPNPSELQCQSGATPYRAATPGGRSGPCQPPAWWAASALVADRIGRREWRTKAGDRHRHLGQVTNAGAHPSIPVPMPRCRHCAPAPGARPAPAWRAAPCTPAATPARCVWRRC